jgi:hypothetical protein
MLKFVSTFALLVFIQFVVAVPIVLLGPNGLINAVEAGAVGVTTGIGSTIENINHPTRQGTVQGSRVSADEAGANVGSAFGHALGH